MPGSLAQNDENPMLALRIVALAFSLLMAACVPVTPRTGSADAEWTPSPNFGVRRANYVILHHTSSDTLEQAKRTLSDPNRSVSSHYLIGRDGQLLQLVDENHRAWHAGAAWWGGQTDINSASIGIELVNNGNEPFTDTQIDALLQLLADIQTRHHIPRANFLGHADVAPGRKVDPSAFFPWKRLADAGFGMWCNDPFTPAPPDFDAQLGLTALGYDPANPKGSIAAFKLHFAPHSSGSDMSDSDKALLYCLLQQRSS